MNLYFDNATTSHPKPTAVLDALENGFKRGGGYSRGAYGRIIETTSKVEQCRDEVGRLFGLSSGDNIFFTLNATSAANLILQKGGYGSTIYISPMEHNAIMRPIEYVSSVKMLNISVLPCFDDGLIDVQALDKIEVKGEGLVVINIQSNVNGVVQRVDEISAWAKKNGLLVMLDTVQGLGYVDFNIDNIDFAIWAGHKTLLGVTGVGGAYIKDVESVESFILGGTGSNSESFVMPNFAPDKFEAGTPNTIGIEALLAALQNRPKCDWEREDLADLLAELRNCEHIEVFTADDFENQGSVFSLRHKRLCVSEFSTALYDNFGVETRSGLHCAPLAHKTLGSFPSGTVRFSLSPYHSKEDLQFLKESIWAMV